MIGIVCGLRTEAKIADRIPDILVGCSAARSDRARQMVQQMIDQGVTRLVSFGLAGGIGPDLAAGDLFLGASVMTAQEAWETDTIWNDKFADHLPTVMCLPVWGSDHMATRIEDKELIFRRTGCMTLDMESHIVARAAHEYNIPFNVVRAVCDPSDMDLPPAARVLLKEDGSVDGRGVYESIKKQPLQIPALIQLGMATKRALRALEHAVDIIAVMEEA